MQAHRRAGMRFENALFKHAKHMARRFVRPADLFAVRFIKCVERCDERRDCAKLRVVFNFP